MKLLLRILISMFFIYLSVSVITAQDIHWEQHYGGSGSDHVRSAQAISDGGYIVAGYTNSEDQDVSSGVIDGSHDIWVVKLSAGGQFQWEQTYGGSETDQAYSVQQTSDGGYIIAGNSYSDDMDVSDNHGSSDIWLVKLDEGGAIEWERNYGSGGYDGVESIRNTGDGGYIVTGYAGAGNYDVSGNYGSRDVWVIKVRANGSIEWEQHYGGSYRDVGEDIAITNDGGYIVVGQSESSDHDVSGNFSSFLPPPPDYWIVKLDMHGNIEWQQNYGGSSQDLPASIFQTANGGYMVMGSTYSDGYDVSANYGFNDIWIMRLCTSTEATINRTACGSYTTPSGDFTHTESGTYTDIIPNTAGCDSMITINLTVHDTVDASIIQAGNVLQAHMFEANYQWGTCNDEFTPIAGETGQTFIADTEGEYAAVIMKDGCIDTSVCHSVSITDVNHHSAGQEGMAVYPNPARGRVTVKRDATQNPATLELANTDGRVIQTLEIPTGESLVTLSLDGPAGVYLITFRQEGEMITRRIIKEH